MTLYEIINCTFMIINIMAVFYYLYLIKSFPNIVIYYRTLAIQKLILYGMLLVEFYYSLAMYALLRSPHADQLCRFDYPANYIFAIANISRSIYFFVIACWCIVWIKRKIKCLRCLDQDGDKIS